MQSVGIHIERGTLSALRLEGTAKAPVMTQFVAEPIPPRPADSRIAPFMYYAHLLDDFLKRHRLPRENAFVALSADHCLVRQFTVQFIAEDQIRKALVTLAEGHIHSVPVEMLEMTFKKVAERKTTAEIFLNAIRRDALRETIRSLRAEGIEPIGIDTPVGGAVNAILSLPDAASERPTMWVDVGADHTTVVVTQASAGPTKGAELKAARQIKLGVQLPRDVVVEQHQTRILLNRAAELQDNQPAEGTTPPHTEKVATDPSVWPAARNVELQAGHAGPYELPDLLDAEGNVLAEADVNSQIEFLAQRKSTASMPAYTGGGALAKEANTAAARLVTELSRTIVAFGLELTPSKIRLSGGGAVLENIAQSLREAFPEIAVEVVPVAFGQRTKPQIAPMLAAKSQALLVPYGMALKGFGVNTLGFEFRRGEFAVEDSFEVIRTPLTMFVLLLVFLMLGVLLFVLRNQSTIGKLRTAAHTAILEAYDRAYEFGSSLKNYKKVEPEDAYHAFELLQQDFAKAAAIFTQDKNMPEVRSSTEVWARVQACIDKVGREPEADIRNDPKYIGNRFPRRSDPKTPRPEDREKLELEWTVTRLVIKGNSIEIKGRAAKIDGVEALKNALIADKEFFTNVVIPDPIKVPEDEKRDSRGNLIDARMAYRIKADVVPPKPGAKPGGTIAATSH